MQPPAWRCPAERAARAAAARSRGPARAAAPRGAACAPALLPQAEVEMGLPCDDRRLHRLLRRHPPRDQGRQAVPARQPAAAELQVGADRLPRPGLVDPVASGAGVPAPARPDARPPDADAPALGPSRRLDYELELGVVHRPAERARRADRDRRRRGARLRPRAVQRLVGARHPGLGIPAARAVPGEELRQHHVAVDRDARGAGAVPQPFARPEGDPQPLPYLDSRRQPRSTARSTSSSRSGCRPQRMRDAGQPATG